MNDVLISVIIPIYQVEKYLDKCIQSVMNQTYKNLEIILVDDGSYDSSPQICDSYEKRDCRIKTIHKKNGGLSDARNAGIKVATGEYIGFVDSDDYIAPTMYEKLLKAILDNNATMGVCNYWLMNEDDSELYCKNKLKNETLTNIEALDKLVDNDRMYYITAWNKLYHKSLFEKTKFPKEKIHEDLYTVHEFFYNSSSVTVISERLYYYIQRRGSIIHHMSVKSLDRVEAIYQRYCFYKENELKDLMYDLPDVMWDEYLSIQKVFLDRSINKERKKEIVHMFNEVYFSRKQDNVWKSIRPNFALLCHIVNRLKYHISIGLK